MRVKFSKSVEYVPEWNKNRELPPGEQVKVTLSPMLFDDMMAVMDAMGGTKTLEAVRDGGAEAVKESVNISGFVRQTGSILPKYATNLAGLEGDEGPITVEQLAGYPMFMNLAIELLMQLVQLSSPSEPSEGNSEGQSD